MEAGEEWDGDEDDDCFFAVANFELLRFRVMIWLADLGMCSNYLSMMTLIDMNTEGLATSCTFVSDRHLLQARVHRC